MTWTLSPESSLEERITIVAIDEKSLNSIGPWPWSRDQMAQLAESINDAGAQFQIHDIVYPEGFGDEDQPLAAALAGNGLIAQLPSGWGQHGANSKWSVNSPTDRNFLYRN